MIVTCQLPIAYAISSTITEPNKASTVRCLLATQTGDLNSNISYTVTCSTGATVTKSVSGNIMTLSFTSPATSTVARGSTYTITIVASYSGQSQTSTITLTQNNVLKTSKPSLAVTPAYSNEAFINCLTAAATAAKTVTTAADFSLVPGAKVAVRFDAKNTAANPTLNVNSTGAKAIRINGAAVTTSFLQTNTVYVMVYDGTYWSIVNFYYVFQQVSTNVVYNCTTAVGTAAKTVSITGFTLSSGATIYVKFTNGNSNTNPTLNVTSTGAKSLRINNVVASPANCVIDSDHVYQITYDGTYWQIIGKYSLKEVGAASSTADYESFITTNKTNVINSVNLENITLTFSAFNTFYWYEAQGEYPPAEW